MKYKIFQGILPLTGGVKKKQVKGRFWSAGASFLNELIHLSSHSLPHYPLFHIHNYNRLKKKWRPLQWPNAPHKPRSKSDCAYRKLPRHLTYTSHNAPIRLGWPTSPWRAGPVSLPRKSPATWSLMLQAAVCKVLSDCELLGHVWLFATPRTVVRQAPLSTHFPGRNTGVSCHFLSRWSSRPTDWTWVSCIAGRLFTICGARNSCPQASEQRSTPCGALYSPNPWITFPWIKISTLILNCTIFCHLSQLTDTSSISRLLKASTNFSHCWMFESVSHHHRPQRVMCELKGEPESMAFISTCASWAIWYKPWTAEFWVSFHSTNPVSIPRLCCFWFWQGLEAAQSGQTRSKCTARLSSFNWSLSLPCFWKTIVWDEALVSSLFTQTQVNYSQKGYVPASLVAKLRPTLQDPMDCSPQAPPSDFRGNNTEVGFHFLLQGIFPTQGLNPREPTSPAFADGFLTTEPPGQKG